MSQHPMNNDDDHDGQRTIEGIQKAESEGKERKDKSDDIEVRIPLLLRMLHTLRRGRVGAACCAHSNNSRQSHGQI